MNQYQNKCIQENYAGARHCIKVIMKLNQYPLLQKQDSISTAYLIITLQSSINVEQETSKTFKLMNATNLVRTPFPGPRLWSPWLCCRQPWSSSSSSWTLLQWCYKRHRVRRTDDATATIASPPRSNYRRRHTTKESTAVALTSPSEAPSEHIAPRQLHRISQERELVTNTSLKLFVFDEAVRKGIRIIDGHFKGTMAMVHTLN